MQYLDLGKFIHEKRLASGMSLNQFAFKNDIDPAILCRIEKQQQDIKFQILIKIANGFQLSTSELIKEFEETIK